MFADRGNRPKAGGFPVVENGRGDDRCVTRFRLDFDTAQRRMTRDSRQIVDETVGRPSRLQFLRRLRNCQVCETVRNVFVDLATICASENIALEAGPRGQVRLTHEA